MGSRFQQHNGAANTATFSRFVSDTSLPPPSYVGRRRPSSSSQPSATISVGGDDWANQVINNVVGRSNTSSPDDNTASAIHDKIFEKKRKFHADRALELKNLPDGATEQDIRLALPDVDIIRIEMDRMDVRHRPGAKLYLKHPHILDNWPHHRDNVYVRNKEVNLCLGTSDKWLVVARLPFTYTEHQLNTLMTSYGNIKSSFLVCSEETGDSKGYGLVKYESQDAANLAKQFLNGKILQDEAIQVDWLNSSYIQYNQLHSKCLYVSNLPPNFRDLALFRKIFSVVKNPPYCQIAMKNGILQDWGLVEFFDNQDAERTQQELDGYALHGSHIRVYYCIPGVNAINIYMSLVTAPDCVSNKGLVDEVPSSTVYAQLQKLGTQNPAFAQNLQSIIQNHIENLQSNSSRSSLPENPHDQAALMILMAAQHQADKEGACLLQNQEVVDVLQNLVCSRDEEGGGTADHCSPPQDPYAQLLKLPGLQMVLGEQQADSSQGRSDCVSTTTSPPPIIANNLNLLSNTQTLNEMLGSLTKTNTATNNQREVVPVLPTTNQQPLISESPDFSKPPPNLLPPPPSIVPPPHPTAAPHSLPPTPTQFLTPPPMPAVPSTAVATMTAVPTPAAMPGFANSGLMSPPQPTQHPLPHPQQQQQPGLGHHPLLSPHFLTPAHSPIPGGAGVSSAYINMNLPTPPGVQTMALPGMYVPGLSGLDGLLTPPLQPQSLFNNPGLVYGLPGLVHGIPPMGSMLQLPSPVLPAGLPPAPMTHPAGLTVASAPPTSTMNLVTSTPQGVKRKASIPPSPEDSPGGRPYIGQHSQGLGGHYADSYWNRKRAKYY